MRGCFSHALHTLLPALRPGLTVEEKIKSIRTKGQDAQVLEGNLGLGGQVCGSEKKNGKRTKALQGGG